ncbi:hypothetical protein [Arthrobacter sp. Z1-15]
MSAPAVLEDLDWQKDAQAVITRLAQSQAVFSADDLRREMRTPPHPNMAGAAFSAARKRGLIQRVGDQSSSAKSRNHSLIRTWARKTTEGETP